MKILVTGALGKVGAATVAALHDAGHDVTGCDRRPPVYEAGMPARAHYFQAELADAGDAYAAVRGHDAVIHAAALPEPTSNPPHVTFQNNLMGVFNTLEAAVRLGVGRYVNVSSETVPGFFFNERPDHADGFPMTEDHPARPQDPYALAKHFGEQLCDAAVRRSDLRCTTIRPSWVQWEGNYERNLAPTLRDPDGAASSPSPSGWAYIDAYDLADALRLAVETDRPEHEVFLIASPDNVVGRPLRELVATAHGDAVPVGELEREDASGSSSAKARRVLGWNPTRSWRDYLDPGTGRLLPEAAARLEAGETGVQRGRALFT
jgi:nucleoside-diphosphate-sugar epimerase